MTAEPLTEIHSIILSLVCASPSCQGWCNVRNFRIAPPSSQCGIICKRFRIGHVEQHAGRQDNSLTTNNRFPCAKRGQHCCESGYRIGQCCPNCPLILCIREAKSYDCSALRERCVRAAGSFWRMKMPITLRKMNARLRTVRRRAPR